MENNGHIKLYRSILESQVFAHQTALKIWIWCLAKASYKDRFITLKIGKGETTIKVLPGQFVFGRLKAEEELGIDGSTIYKWIQKFASDAYDNMISLKSNNQYTIVTLSNWDNYQSLDEQIVTTKEQPSNNQRTTKEQQRSSSVTQTRIVKNSKESKEIYSLDNIKIAEGLKPIMIEWLEYKKGRKESYKSEKSLQAWANELTKLSNNDQTTARAIIQKSMANSWKGIFPLKNELQTKTNNYDRHGEVQAIPGQARGRSTL